jgi:hypothetical protein
MYPYSTLVNVIPAFRRISLIFVTYRTRIHSIAVINSGRYLARNERGPPTRHLIQIGPWRGTGLITAQVQPIAKLN